jgi:FkbM family methyltransferase
MNGILLRGVPLELFEHEAVCDAIRAAGDFYEAPLLDELRSRRPSEGVIVDVGAHIGNHSVYWSAFVPHAAILAFEPAPETFALLYRNLGLASRGTALADRVALSDRCGSLTMRVDPVNMGRTRVDPDGELRVRAARLDDYGLDGVTLVKVDVEGWQEHVLEGARETLARCRPALLAEDEEDTVEPTLAGLGLDGYRRVASWPGANHLWEWAA